MNLARVLEAPVLFLCENNLFSSHLHIALRQPTNSVARYAVAHGVPSVTVDGNDVVAVAQATAEAAALMRNRGGPFMIECVTYRWRGHVGHREDEDVGVMRKDDLAQWKGRDPIARLAASLETRGTVAAGSVARLRETVQARVDAAWEQAMNDPYPAAGALMGRVWADAVGGAR